MTDRTMGGCCLLINNYILLENLHLSSNSRNQPVYKEEFFDRGSFEEIEEDLLDFND